MTPDTRPEYNIGKVDNLYGNSMFHEMGKNIRDFTTKAFKPFRGVRPQTSSVLTVGLLVTATSAVQGELSPVGAAVFAFGAGMVAADKMEYFMTRELPTTNNT